MPPAQINNRTDDYKKTHSADAVINKGAAPAEPMFPPRVYTFSEHIMARERRSRRRRRVYVYRSCMACAPRYWMAGAAFFLALQLVILLFTGCKNEQPRVVRV
jgi:hypothetical protein